MVRRAWFCHFASYSDRFTVIDVLCYSGARCEANTFDGERCVYGALTDRIRNVLKSYKAVTSQTIRRDLYTEFLRK